MFSARDSENWYSSDEEGDDKDSSSLSSLIKTVRSKSDTTTTTSTQQQPSLVLASSTPAASTSQSLPNALASLFANSNSNTSGNNATQNALNSILGFVQRQTSQPGTPQTGNPVSSMLTGLMPSGSTSPSVSGTNGWKHVEVIHAPGRTDPREGRERKNKSDMRFRVLHWGKNEYSVKYEEDRPTLPPIELTTPTEIKLAPFFPPPETTKQPPVDPRPSRPTDPRTKRPQDPRTQPAGMPQQQDAVNRDPRIQNRDPRLAAPQGGSPGPDHMGDGGMPGPMGDGMLPIPGPPMAQMNMGPMRFPVPPRGQGPPGPGMGFPPRMPMRGMQPGPGMPPRGMPPHGMPPRGPGPGFGGPPGPRPRFGRPPFGSPPNRMMGPRGPPMNNPRMQMGGSPRMDGPPAPFGMPDQRGPRPNARFGGPMQQQMPMQQQGPPNQMMNRLPGPQNQNINPGAMQQAPPNQSQKPTDPRLARQLSQSKLSDPRTQQKNQSQQQQGSASPQQGANSPLEAPNAPQFSANVRTTQTDPRLRPRNVNSDPRLAKQEAASEKSAQSKEGKGGDSPDPSTGRDLLKRPANKTGLSMYSIPKKAKKTEPVEADSTSNNSEGSTGIEHRLVPSAHHRLQQTASFNQGPARPNQGSQNAPNTRPDPPQVVHSQQENDDMIPAEIVPAEDISLKDMFKVKDPTASPFC